MERIRVCPAKNATCNAYRLLGHFENTCRRIRHGTNHWRGRGRGISAGRPRTHRSSQSMGGSTQEQSLGFVEQEKEAEYDLSFGSSSEHLAMAIKRDRKEVEIKNPNARVMATVCGKEIWLWVDSGSMVTIFCLQEPTRVLGRANNHLMPGEDEFLDCNNNCIRVLGKAEVTIELNGWVSQRKIAVISGNHQSVGFIGAGTNPKKLNNGSKRGQ